MENRYIATFILHALGDAIGFKNGDWKYIVLKQGNFSYGMVNEFLYEFISYGGINDIDLKQWYTTDNTIFGLITSKEILDNPTNIKKLITSLKKKYLITYKNMIQDKSQKTRYIDTAFEKFINKYIKVKDFTSAYFEPSSRNNLCTSRTISIGLAFHSDSKEDLEKLIELSVLSCKITNNSPIGWLSGLVTALFTSFAIQNIDLNKWPHKMLKIIESDNVKKYIRKEYYEDELADYDEFINNWKKYLDFRFDEDMPIRSRAQSNLIYRTKFHYEKFTQPAKGVILGDTGFSAIIMAYDALLDCNRKLETLLIYAAVHPGDGDTVASIACAWYGAFYGMGNLQPNIYKNLEYNKLSYEMGNLFYKKFFLQE
jgi:ADP-ribosylglycohydrolase